ncbi:MAG: ABC transporter permease [Clostridiales bacterium]|nr:ABC transporter permease [Clostridiales bacterium]
MTKRKINLEYVLPFGFLIILFIVFSILNGASFFRMYNIRTIVDSMIPLCIGGYGMLFVIAQGSIDMSAGSNLAFSATLGAVLAAKHGSLVILVICILIGAGVGFINGILVSKFKVSSIMATLAQLIILRSLVVILSKGSVIFVSPSILKMNRWGSKGLIFVIATIVAIYLFEYTKLGFSARSIGENEIVCNYVGLKTRRIKTIAYVVAGAFTGLAAVLTISRIGGVDPNMGQSFELQVMLAVFVGGVPVNGGSKSSIVKIIIGALLFSILQSGLVLSNANSETVELIQGLMLIIMVALILKANKMSTVKTSKE